MTPDPTRRELLSRLRRLAQVADVAYKRWWLHARTCAQCTADTPGCLDGAGLFARALAFDSAVGTLKGTLEWKGAP